MKGGNGKISQETLELQTAKKQEMPATLKQLGYLVRLLEIKEIPENLTRAEAGKWIDELVQDKASQ